MLNPWSVDRLRGRRCDYRDFRRFILIKELCPNFIDSNLSSICRKPQWPEKGLYKYFIASPISINYTTDLSEGNEEIA